MGLHRLLAIQCPTSRTWTRADHSTRHGGRIGGGTLLSVCLAHNVPDTPAAAGVCAASSHSARHRHRQAHAASRRASSVSCSACAATSSSRRPPSEVTIAGRYRVEQLLGRGGMGAVYAVVDVASNERLALKRLSRDASPTMAALFEREYHTLAGLKHPCIVEVFEYGSDAEGPFYTMELIEGSDLSKAAPMPWREACRYLRDVASLLGVLHARQLLHRDLSPRNLLHGPAGRLKLIDFGALTTFGPSSEIVGTPPFVAPEGLRTRPLDQRSDLFGLGALAYWLLTGSHAFPARTLNELHDLWRLEPSAPSDVMSRLDKNVPSTIPPELDALVASLLRIEPSERLASTSELIDQLNAIAELEPESEAVTVQGYLDSKAFVGRLRERERTLALIAEVEQGHVRTVIVEGDPGVGRSRFLKELVVVTRLSGALPIVAGENLGRRPYGVAESLLLGLLRALPEPTRQAMTEHAALLGTMSKAVRAELRQTAPQPALVCAGRSTRALARRATRLDPEPGSEPPVGVARRRCARHRR